MCSKKIKCNVTSYEKFCKYAFFLLRKTLVIEIACIVTIVEFVNGYVGYLNAKYISTYISI